MLFGARVPVLGAGRMTNSALKPLDFLEFSARFRQLSLDARESESAASALSQLKLRYPHYLVEMQRLNETGLFGRPVQPPSVQVPRASANKVTEAILLPPSYSPHPTPLGIASPDRSDEPRKDAADPASAIRSLKEQSYLKNQLNYLDDRVSIIWEAYFEQYEERLGKSRSSRTEQEYLRRFELLRRSSEAYSLPGARGAPRSKMFTAALLTLSRELSELGHDIRAAHAGLSLETVKSLEAKLDRLESEIVYVTRQWEFKEPTPRPPRRKFSDELGQMIGERWDNWESRLVEAAKTKVVWLLPICVILATGCRPACMSPEVRNSLGRSAPVTVRRSGSGALEISIYASKQENKETAGPPGVGWRTITVSNDAPWTEILSAAMPVSGEIVITPGSVRQLGEAISDLSLRLFGPEVRVNAMLLRHRFATCLRRWGLTLEQQAMAMGHGSTETIKTYGIQEELPANVSLLGKVLCVRTERSSGTIRVSDQAAPQERRPESSVILEPDFKLPTASLTIDQKS